MGKQSVGIPQSCVQRGTLSVVLESGIMESEVRPKKYVSDL